MAAPNDAPPFRSDSFVHVLIGDCSSAFHAVEKDDTPMARRAAVRATFAAIEGLLSIVRCSREALPLKRSELSIVREESIEVPEGGKINTRARFTPLDRSSKAIFRVVVRVRPEYDLDFGHSGWDALLKSLKVRQRLTHPKILGDLAVEDSELHNVRSGFYWFLAFAIEVMNEAKESAREHFSGSPRRDPAHRGGAVSKTPNISLQRTFDTQPFCCRKTGRTSHAAQLRR